MAKALASRLKNVLPSIIFETQSAFLQERVIFDNVIVAYEAYQYMRRRKRGRDGSMALKLDRAKAYDHLEWRFIHTMMIIHLWVKKILSFVTSVSYNIHVNERDMS